MEVCSWKTSNKTSIDFIRFGCYVLCDEDQETKYNFSSSDTLPKNYGDTSLYGEIISSTSKNSLI